jgi:hypothetical protein
MICFLVYDNYTYGPWLDRLIIMLDTLMFTKSHRTLHIAFFRLFLTLGCFSHRV